MTGTFASLGVRNYRIWASGGLVSNIGTWMQRTAQDWIVLAQLTDHDATAVGVVLACQFAPQVLLLPLTGLAADRLDLRTLILFTQTVMAAVSVVLGVLTVTGVVQLWHVCALALLFGGAAAFDAPARQTFVFELVAGPRQSNAIALNTISFNIARTVGPAVAGLLIVVAGAGWVFLANSVTYAAVVVSLLFIRVDELHRTDPLRSRAAGLTDGFRYVVGRRDLRTMLVMFFLLGTFGANFQIFIPTMSVTVFDRGAGAFGFLSSVVAAGAVAGALIVARRGAPGFLTIVIGAAVFTVALGIAAVAPSFAFFAGALVLVGAAIQVFTTATFSLVQLSTDAAMRGRVIAILLAVGLGGLPIGAPLTGAVSDAFGPRWAVLLGAASGVAAVGVGSGYLRGQRRVSLLFRSANDHH